MTSSSPQKLTNSRYNAVSLGLACLIGMWVVRGVTVSLPTGIVRILGLNRIEEGLSLQSERPTVSVVTVDIFMKK
jgi:hypothetical protein